MSARPIRPERALLHPVYFAALLVLVVNDHALKGAGLLPGWLTGKLSDLAGVFVAPPLLAWLLRARTRHAVFVAHAVVGLGFAALELSPELSGAADVVYRIFGFSWRQVSDPTDLLALFVLPLALRHTLSRGAEEGASLRRVAEHALVAASLLACAASTGAKVLQAGPCGGPDCGGDGYSPPEDCNDTDPELYPGRGCPDLSAEDVCDDGRDQDGDGLIDCEDPDCALACADLEGACAAASVHDFDALSELDGSTVTGTSVTDASCAGADAPEVIFDGRVSGPGVLSLGVPEGHAIVVRGACFDRSTELACSKDAGKTVEVPITDAGPLTVVVEALDPLAPSAFQVPVSFVPLRCGDGVRVDPEACDDGNLDAGDGCDATCHVEYGVLCAALPDASLGVSSGTFAGGTKAFVGSCGGSLDRVERGFRYVPQSGSVTFQVTSSADVTLYVTSGCGDMVPSRGCVDLAPAGGTESLTVHPVAGEVLTAFVELPLGAPPDATYALEVSEP